MYPADPGCSSARDRPEGPDCGDGLDNDGDGLVDFPADPGCASSADNSERSLSLAYDDGIDNDGDGSTDFPDDPGCSNFSDPDEIDASLPCDDGIDNDGDLRIDYPDDPNCTSSEGPTEESGEGDDEDEDGVPDLDDNCPFVQNSGQENNDGDSEGDACDDDDDNDNLPDSVETNTGVYISPTDTGTDPFVADTDADGLSDGDEVQTYLTDPTNPDTDGDGYTDSHEVHDGSDPNDANEYPSPPPAVVPALGVASLSLIIAALTAGAFWFFSPRRRRA